MSNELSTVLKNTDLSIFKDDLEENDAICNGSFDSFPIVKTTGKKFVLTVGGNPVGESSKEIVAVIIKSNKNKSNKYYAGAYNPKETKAPDCSSADDVRPDASVEHPQSTLCANCPHHVRGGACRPHKRIILCFPDQKNDTYNLYRLDVPADTIKVLTAYGLEFKNHKVPISLALTKITMDDSVAYAKFKFERVGWFPMEVYKGLIERAKKDPMIQTMLESTVIIESSKEGEEVAVAQKEEPAKKSTKKSPLANVDLEKELDDITKDL